MGPINLELEIFFRLPASEAWNNVDEYLKNNSKTPLGPPTHRIMRNFVCFFRWFITAHWIYELYKF
jgi:hypothetical protein